MNATLVTLDHHSKNTGYCVYSVSEAAAKLGCSESAVRREAKKLGVKKIAGRVVAGYISWSHSHGAMDVRLPYSA